VLVDLLSLFRLLQDHRERPGTRPRVRVVERHAPLDDARRDRNETLGHLEVLAGGAIGAPRREVRRLDYERIALVPAARVAEVKMHARAQMRPLRMDAAAALDRDDAVLVDHLVTQRDRVLALDDLVEAAVTGRHHRRRNAARDAAIVEAEILVAV